VTGTVKSQAGSALAGAVVAVLDGVNANTAAIVAADGTYTLRGLTPGGMSISASANTYEVSTAAATVTSTGPNALNFTLRTALPWKQTGNFTGTFQMPTYIRNVHIRATWNGAGNPVFIVTIAGQQVVNFDLSTSPDLLYDATLSTTGGTVQIVSSDNIVDWSFTEVR
jgi:hypothetical protein